MCGKIHKTTFEEKDFNTAKSLIEKIIQPLKELQEEYNRLI